MMSFLQERRSSYERIGKIKTSIKIINHRDAEVQRNDFITPKARKLQNMKVKEDILHDFVSSWYTLQKW